MQLPLRLQLKASPTYLVFMAGGHILAGVAVCFLPWSGVLRAGILLLLGVLLLRLGQAASRRLPVLLLRADGCVELLQDDTEAVPAHVSQDSVVWPWLVVLHLEMEQGGRRAWVLFPDGLAGADAHRQLRLWLRWRSGAAED
ncbi:MAG TPA: protein YgfX [Rhodocyclaceae bacterium]|nr:protein YgfX [Rhodocyclaceae bacterium]